MTRWRLIRIRTAALRTRPACGQGSRPKLQPRSTSGTTAIRVGVLTVLLYAPTLALASGEHYLDAYNTLAAMLNERAAVANTGLVPLKQAGDPITQAHLNSLRTKTVALMTSCFLATTDGFNLDQRKVAQAFPAGLRWDAEGTLIEPSLMDGIGRNGYFTKVPPDCTASGEGVYANSFSDVPLLWMHFEEIARALQTLRYTRESYYVGWLNNDEPDWRSVRTTRTTWETAMAATDAEFEGSEPMTIEDFPPHAFAIGRSIGVKAIAHRRNSYAYGVVSRLDTRRRHRVHFYNYATIGRLFGGTYLITAFDNTGVETQVGLDRWTHWDSSDRTYAGTVWSKTKLGEPARPHWGPPSHNGFAYEGPGWRVNGNVEGRGLCAVIEWEDFSNPTLENPELDDPEADGIAATGCEYTGQGHEPAADPDWRNMMADPVVKFPLGISSGLTSGGLRVKAYVSEYMIGAEAHQMFSLDTAVIDSASGADWGFVTIKRPSGMEIVFALAGTQAGRPVNSANRYILAPVEGGFELHFPDQDNIVHVFGNHGTLRQVRMRKTHHETRVNGNPDAWPGLAISRANTAILHVVSPLWVAAPVYAGKLMDDVKYYDHEGTHLGTMDSGTGSRTFTWRDADGTPRTRTRVSVTNGYAETTYETMVDDVLFMGNKTTRSETYDELAEEKTVTQTRVLYPDSLSASSNTVTRTFARFAWGYELVAERTVVPGGVDRITRYAYYTNAIDTNNLGRLRRVLPPDGNWERTTYDARGRRTTVAAPFNNAGPESDDDACRVTRYHYGGDPALPNLAFPADDQVAANDHRPRLIIEEALGREVSRTYHAYLPDRYVTRRCATAHAAYDDPANLATEVFVITNGAYAGYTGRIQHPDGTITTYAYDYDADADLVTTIRRTGATGDNEHPTNGTEQVSVKDAAGRTRSTLTRDIASGILLSGTVYTRDAFGRPTCVSNTLSGACTRHVYNLGGVVRTIDADGIVTTFEYTKSQGKHLAATTRLGITTRHEYDSHGNIVTTWHSAPGQPHVRVAFGYNAAGTLMATTNELGLATSYAYTTNAAGESITTVTTPDGATRIATHYRDGRLRSVSGTAEPAACYAYGVDADGAFTVEYRGADDRATEWTRTYVDMLGRTRKVVHADGYTVRYTYDARGRQTATSDGFTTSLTSYDDRSTPFRTAIDMNANHRIDLAGPDRVSESRTRYGLFEGTAVRETIQMAYAEFDRDTPTVLSRNLAALNGAESWSIVHGITNHTSVTRDPAAAARTETLTRSDGTQLVQFYTNGLLKSTLTKDRNGTIVTARSFTHDAWNRLSAITETAANGETRITRHDYNHAGQLVTSRVETAAATHTTTFEVDRMGRTIKTVRPDGGEVNYTYNERGEMVRQSGAGLYPVAYTYDPRGRLATMSTTRAGPRGPADTTTWNYDPQRGWLTSKVYADGTRVRYTYQRNGLLRRRTWARGVSTDYAYDEAGALARIDYSDATPGIRTTRDRLGRVTELTDAIGTWTNRYLPGGWLAEVTLPHTADGRLELAYDPHGRRTNMAVRISGSTLTRAAYTFNDAGQIATVSDGTHAAEYSYGADGHTVTRMDVGELMTVHKTFDGHHRLRSLVNQSPTGIVSSSAYTCNAAHQRTAHLLADGAQWRYEYDDMGQLTSATKYFADGLPVGGGMFRYTFDTIGNRKTAARFDGASTAAAVYTANALNQYTQRTVPGALWATGRADPAAVVSVRQGTNAARLANRHADHFWTTVPADNTTALFATTNLQIRARRPHPQGAVTNSLVRTETRSALLPGTPETFTHDADGNLLADGLRTYLWNAENRLIATESLPTLPAAQRIKVENVYDHIGRRTRKTVFSAYDGSSYTATNTTTCIYDGWNLVAELTHTPTNPHTHTLTNPQTHTLTNLYLWGLDLSDTPQGAGGIGGLLAMTRDTGTYLYCFDGNGNVVNLIDTHDGTIAATYEYSPFGELLRASGPMARSNPARWSTKHTDDETGLVMYPKRPYAPTLGRWLCRDRIGEKGGLNLYGFLNNQPLTQVDPLGTDAFVAYRRLGIKGMGWTHRVTGHVYLAFNNDNMDGNPAWAQALNDLGYARQPWHTFSFHPDSVRTETSEGNKILVLYTGSSWVDRDNFEADIQPVARGDAQLILVTKDPCEQAELLRTAHRSYLANQGARNNDHGYYSFMVNNCGSWAKRIVDEAGLAWPTSATFLNGGTAVGGPLDYTLLPQASYVLAVVGYEAGQAVGVVTRGTISGTQSVVEGAQSAVTWVVNNAEVGSTTINQGFENESVGIGVSFSF